MGFFTAVQAAYYKKNPKNVNDTLKFVEEAYNEYPIAKINRCFLTLQSVLNCIIDNVGANDFKIPHMNKDKLEKSNKLPHVLDVTDKALQYLDLD